MPRPGENRGKRALADVRGAFDFQGVRFVYPGTDNDALADFSLRVEPGETLGIVGASGSGKSTLMGLLLRFHRPVDGCIRLDGEDMNSIDLRSYRRRLAVVSQETILFEGTVRENIRYSVHRVDEGRLRAALADITNGPVVSTKSYSGFNLLLSPCRNLISLLSVPVPVVTSRRSARRNSA